MPKSLFKLCYLIALYCGDNVFTTSAITQETQQLYIDQLVQEDMIDVSGKLTDKGEILMSEVIRFYNNFKIN